MWGRRARDRIAQGSGDRLVALLRRVLVDERGSGRRVAQARHELLRRRAGIGCEGRSSVAEVMEVQLVDADGSRRAAPRCVQARTAERLILRAGKHETIEPRRSPLREVFLEF